MRHGKKVNHLGRTTSHRKAMMSNLANSLIAAKRIETTLAKAKELRKFIEPIITKAKEDSTHNRRTVFAYLQDKESIKTLFGEIGERVAERNGGYTRIIKLGQRQGDNAEIALIELVDYNTLYNESAGEEKETQKAGRTRRGRGGKKATETATTAETAAPAAVAAPEAPAADSTETSAE